MLAALITNAQTPPPPATFAPVKEPIIVGVTNLGGQGGNGGTVGNGPGGGS